jgi:hypothetical protein
MFILCCPHYTIFYTSEKYSTEHFILYIESYKNNLMCEICFVDIAPQYSIHGKKLFLYSFKE